MSKTATDADTLALLHRLNAEFIRAVSASDVAWFDRNLSADFLNSNPDGTLSDRAAFLRRVALPLAASDFGVEQVCIRRFGNAALIHGRTTYTQPDGQRGAGRYTDVWALLDGRWFCAAADVTRC